MNTSRTAVPLRAGCQTFTWEMLGDVWRDRPDELLAAVSAAGYSGIEITDTMIGNYAGRPQVFERALKQHELSLVAFACGSDSGFTEDALLERDLAMAERAADFTAAFPGALLSFGSATIMSEGPRVAKFAAAARFYEAAAERGRAVGVDVAVHPSSHHDTLLLTRADYDALFALLDSESVGWVPDTGHILRGGHDILDTLRTYHDRIRYLHLKDVDAAGQWQMLGAGLCDTRAVLDLVASAPRFNGWLVLEEESEEARRDPARAVAKNRDALRGFGV